MTTTTMKTLKSLKDHKGEVHVWVAGLGCFVKVSKHTVLKTIGGDVPFSREGLHDSTPIDGEVRDGVFYIN